MEGLELLEDLNDYCFLKDSASCREVMGVFHGVAVVMLELFCVRGASCISLFLLFVALT